LSYLKRKPVKMFMVSSDSIVWSWESCLVYCITSVLHRWVGRPASFLVHNKVLCYFHTFKRLTLAYVCDCMEFFLLLWLIVSFRAEPMTYSNDVRLYNNLYISRYSIHIIKRLVSVHEVRLFLYIHLLCQCLEGK